MLVDLPMKDGSILILKKEYTVVRDKDLLRRMRIKLTTFDISIGYEADTEYLQDEDFLRKTLLGFAEKIGQMTEQEFTQWLKENLANYCTIVLYRVARKQKESFEVADAPDKKLSEMYTLFLDFLKDLGIL